MTQINGLPAHAAESVVDSSSEGSREPSATPLRSKKNQSTARSLYVNIGNPMPHIGQDLVEQGFKISGSSI